MMPFPHYIEPLFRPPSEADSLILQITNGCSWNRCAFCEMYTAPQKQFSIKNQADVFVEIERAAQLMPDMRRIFLADGDAMVLSTRRLLGILKRIAESFPRLNRVSSYCLPRNVKNKSAAELSELQDAGLKLLYIGAESGDDTVLERINKGETYASTLQSILKLKQAGVKTSVMLLNGLGGVQYSEQHADNSARLINECQPNYLATLVVSFPMGEQRFVQHFPEGFQFLDQNGLFKEMRRFINATELHSTLFRSDHASNYLVLKGVLGRDKQKILQQLDQALTDPESVALRKEWQRGL